MLQVTYVHLYSPRVADNQRAKEQKKYITHITHMQNI